MKRPLKKHYNNVIVRNGRRGWKGYFILLLFCLGFTTSYAQSFSQSECICLNNATVDFDGQFRDVITVNSAAGESWMVRSATGLYDPSSAAPPAAPIPYAIDYPLTEVSNGVYELEGMRLSGTDWSIELRRGVDVFTLNSLNTCAYPSTEVDGDMGTCIDNVEIYRTDNPDELVETVIWSLNGGGQILGGQGSNEVIVQWDDVVGDYELSFIGQAISYDGQTTPPCNFSGSTIVSVMDEEAFSMACNNQVNISLNGNCALDIEADMILEDMKFTNDSYDLIITDTAADTIVPGPTIGMEYIDMALQVSVVHECSGNSCWGYVVLEDKAIPLLDCGPNIIVDCDESIDPSSTGYPVGDDAIVIPLGNQKYNVIGFDKCSDVTLQYEDTPASTDLCDGPFSSILDRRWFAIDGSGNVTECTHKIFVNKATIDDITFPGHLDDGLIPGTSLEACGNFPTLPNGNPHPSFTGVPQGVFCLNVQVNYDDTVIPKCGDHAVKIRRRWTITDLCTVETREYTQFISILDTRPPVCVAPPEYEVSSTELSCSAIIPVPPPIIVNECSDYSYTVSYKLADENGNPYINPTNDGVVELPDGSFLITGLDEINGDMIWIIYYIADACGNTVQCFTEVTIIDEVQPIPVCDLHTFVGLNENGVGYAGINSFDDGSWDNCGIDYMEIRRTDGFKCGVSNIWSDQVKFCCNDVGNTIMIELRVVDHAGNSNICTVEAEVQDNDDPVFVSCPADITIDCDDDTVNLDQYGSPVAEDNCSVSVSTSVSRNINSCGTGLIRRTFTAEDDQGNSVTCSQRIRVLSLDPFYINNNNPNDPNDDVIWPGSHTVQNGCVDQNVDSDDLPQGKQRPIIVQEGCSQVSYNFNDVVFQYTDEACFKILRTWKVIDDCVFNPLTGAGSWTYTQIIKVENSTAPIFSSGCSAGDYTITQTADCRARIQGAANANDDCTGLDELEFTYRIDEGNDGSIDYNDTGRFVDRTVDFGTHRILWTVTDACGNITNCAAIVTVDDNKPPTPYCRTEVVTVIMEENGTAGIWASDFDNGSYDNCADSDELRISFSTNPNDNSRQYTCADLTDGLAEIELSVYVTDPSGNQDFCTTTLILQDNQDHCGDGSNGGGGNEEGRVALGGHIQNAEYENLNGVSVALQANLPEFPIVSETETDGGYSFSNLLAENDYSIIPTYETSYKKGVSTLDLVLIQRHLLELELFTTPYEVIAADINNSERITASDLLQLRKLILGVYTELPDNSSWRFVDATQEFLDIHEPWPFNEELAMPNVSEDYMDANFVAVKIGDINNSAVLNFQGKSSASTRSAAVVSLEDTYLEIGQHDVMISMKEATEIFGMQFTLNVNESLVEHIDMASNYLTVSEGNYVLLDGKLSVSIYETHARSIERDMITLIVDVKKAGYLSEMITMANTGIQNEIYTDHNGSYESTPIVLEMETRDEEVKHSFELLQNVPNPFTTTTDIGFVLPKTQKVVLTVMDMTGKVMITRQGIYTKGYNIMTIDVSQINASGVLYYTLETEGHSSSKKMIVIK